MATRYRLDGLGSTACGGGGEFPHLGRSAIGPTQPSVKRVPSLSPGNKAAGVWGWPAPLITAEVKDGVEL